MTPTMPASPLNGSAPDGDGTASAAIDAQQDPALSWVDRYGIWLLAGFVFLLFFYRLGSYWLFDVDEPRYAEAAREMIEKRSWITPYFNYAIRLEKPVFFYWLIILSYKTFGVSEFAARFVSASMATGLTAMTYALGRHIISKRFGFWCGVILATSLEFIGMARMSITDMTLASLMGGTFISLFLASAKHPRWWLVGGLFSGLAILTKGPVGMVLPGCALLLYSLLTRQWRAFLTPYFPAAIVLAIAIATPWYYLAWQENGQFFIDSLLQNNVSRFSGAIDYHSEPVYYYLIVLIAGFLPWTPFLGAGFFNSLQEWKTANPLKQTLSLPQQLHWYALIWGVLIFVFFSVADTKLLTYILPMFPALAIWTAFAFENTLSDAASYHPELSGWLKKTAWTLFGILALLGGVFATQMGRLLPKEAAHISGNPANWAACLVLLLGTFTFSQMIQKKRIASALVTMGSTFAVLAMVALQGIVPHVNQATQGTLMHYLERIGSKPVATYEITKPSLTFYAQRHIPQIQHDDNNEKTERDKLKAFLQSGCTLNSQGQVTGKRCQPVYIITKNRFIEPLEQNLPDGTPLTFLDRGKIYSLIQVQYHL